MLDATADGVNALVSPTEVEEFDQLYEAVGAVEELDDGAVPTDGPVGTAVGKYVGMSTALAVRSGTLGAVRSGTIDVSNGTTADAVAVSTADGVALVCAYGGGYGSPLSTGNAVSVAASDEIVETGGGGTSAVSVW